MNYLKMLTKFGVSSAHPGGFAATLDQLQHFNIPTGSHILEVGCGTGRTSCHLASNGYQVTAIDVESSMIAKAQKRAKEQNLQINFKVADICSLPFEDDQFDVIVAESVTNFVHIEAALTEYYRVLKLGGCLYDRELIEAKPIPLKLQSRLYDFFGFKQLLSTDQWISILTHHQFTQASSWGHFKFDLDSVEDKYPDDFQYFDEQSIMDAEVFQTAFEYYDIIQSYKEYLGSVVIFGYKR